MVVISMVGGSTQLGRLDDFHHFGIKMPGAGAIHPISFGSQGVKPPIIHSPEWGFNGRFIGNFAKGRNKRQRCVQSVNGK
jgi:hypothetical protein